MTLWAQLAGPGASGAFLTSPAVPSGERAEPSEAHDFPQNGLLGTFPSNRQIKSRRVNLFREAGYKRNPGSHVESAVGEQDVFINGGETRKLGRGATCGR